MADVVGQRIRGNLTYFDFGAHRRRLVDAIGPDVIKHLAASSDFQENGATGTDPPGWTTTVVEAGGGGSSEAQATREAGATFELLTDNADNDGISIQRNGEVFELTADQDLYFGCKVKCNDVTQSDWFLGLAITDTAILGGATDRIGFETVDATTGLDFVVEKDSTQTASEDVGTLVDDTYIELEFYWDGGKSTLQVFVDGVAVTAPATTNLPNDEALRLSLEFLTGEAVAQTLTFQYLRVIQIGR